MSSLTAQNVHITDQLLAALAEEAPLPVSTSALLDKLSLRGYQNTVLRLLNRLAKRGEIEKWESLGVMLTGSRCCYWRSLAKEPPS